MLIRSKLDKEFFSSPPDLTYCFHANLLRPYQEGTHDIVSLKTLEQLLFEKRIKKEDPVLRFIVDMSGTAWFARETRPDVTAPKHFQMTGESQENARCRTAGNIKFKNSSCRVLKNINHKSGDFQPSFHSLRLFLALLIVNEEKLPFKLPRKIIIKELNNQGELKCKHKWPLRKIKEWTDAFRHDKDLMRCLTKQDADTRQVCYTEMS